MKFNPSTFISVPAERFPNCTCMKYKEYTFKYFETNERANKLAWGIMNLGISKGTRVATLQYNCQQLIECFLATWKAGIIIVPLNTRNSVQENVNILKDSKATAIIFGSEFIEHIEQLRKALPDLKEFICYGHHYGKFTDYENIIVNSNPSEPNIDVDENDIHGIYYTSGTTGLHRGVIHTYRNRKEIIAKIFMNSDILINENEVFLHVCPLTHAAGYLFMPFYLKGAKHILLDKFDTDVVLETIERERVTCILLVPTMIVMLLENKNISKYKLRSLKRIFYGTAPMPTTKLEKDISIFGNIFRQNYGLTEAVQPLTYLTPEEHVTQGKAEEVKRLGSISRRALGIEIKIVNNNDVEVQTGEIGEIVLRGPHISPGYLNIPELGKEANRDGWFHTGDLAYKDNDGYFFIVDRKKDMIISGGFNIYSKEVEVVLDSHPSILESAIIGAPDEKRGEVVKAFIVFKKDKNKLTDQDIIDFCKSKGLTKYKIPKIIQFIERLPKNENGKVLKKVLKKL